MREQNGLTMEETPGTRFGNYELVRRIDIGGMGEVYLARQLTAFSRSVAIKIIRSDLVHDTTARARFLREAEVSAHLKHEHILPLFDFGEVDGRLYLVTPYIEGGTLAAHLAAHGPLSLTETHKLFVPLVQAVAYIHRRGVVHRDLKPSNIMLDSEDGAVYVRLIDFGIATLQGRAASPPLTVAGHEMGTVAFMAPERLSGVAAPSNDIFSLGVILHLMLTGRMPNAAEAARLPEALARVVRQAITANINERYASAEELLKGFEQAFQELTGPRVSGGGHSRPPQTPVRPVAEPAPLPVERVSLAQSASMPDPISQTPAPVRPPTRLAFTPEDYNAPTTSFQRPTVAHIPNNRPPLFKPRPPKPPRTGRASAPRRNKLVLTISILTVVLLIVFAGMLYYGYQVVDAPNVSINFSPRTQVISQVATFKADPKAQTLNISQGIIPARALQSAVATSTQSGQTTGQVDCVFGGIGCQHGVSQDDVNNLVAQMQPDLNARIKQDLESQINAKHGTQLGAINIVVTNSTATPPVGAPGRTVTVTLTEQGSVGYFVNSDASSVAHQDLLNKVAALGSHYQAVDSTVTINAFKVQSIDQTSGISTIAVAEGVVALYHFTAAELQTMTQGLLGKSLDAARTFLQNQPGIDPASVAIHFTSGHSTTTLPGDTQHIHLVPLDPSSLPNVPVTPVTQTTSIPSDPTPVFTATATTTG